MLEALYKFNNVQITHTFSSHEVPILTVRCLKNTTTIEITNLVDNTVTLFDNIEESAEELQQLLINENVIV